MIGSTILAESLCKCTAIAQSELTPLFARPKDPSHGDIALPCFSIAKNWKMPPPQAAQKIKDSLILPELFSKVEVVGPYLNFFYSRAQLAKLVMSEIRWKNNEVGKKPSNNKNIIIDYSHPNIAKIFHVGHLRTTLIGLSLVRLLQHQGYNVISINHLGDWGTQFGFVWAGCELWGKPHHPTVDGLVDLYVKASVLKTQQLKKEVPQQDLDKPDMTEMARGYFLRLEAGDKDAVEFWQWCLDISMEYFQRIYARLGIHFDYYHGESFYQSMLPEVEKMTRESGILENSEGALGIDLGEELGFARIFAEDGRSLYITRDIATAIYREKTFTPEKILYVVSAQQTLHFKQLIAIFNRMHNPVAHKMLHIPFGFVPGMKTREGGAISLEGYVNDAKEHALKVYREEVTKRPEGVNEEEIAEKVAIGATYFYFLSHSNNKDFQFKMEEALTFQGDSGPYLQYAYGRLTGIKLKAEESGISTDGELNYDLLKEDEAHALIVKLSEFEDTVQKAAEVYEPNILAQYLLELGRTISSSYKILRVVGEEKDLSRARLALYEATRTVLGVGLYLLGVPVIDRM